MTGLTHKPNINPRQAPTNETSPTNGAIAIIFSRFFDGPKNRTTQKNTSAETAAQTTMLAIIHLALERKTALGWAHAYAITNQYTKPARLVGSSVMNHPSRLNAAHHHRNQPPMPASGAPSSNLGKVVKDSLKEDTKPTAANKTKGDRNGPRSRNPAKTTMRDGNL